MRIDPALLRPGASHLYNLEVTRLTAGHYRVRNGNSGDHRVAATVWRQRNGTWRVDDLEGIQLTRRTYRIKRDAIDAISIEADRANKAEVERRPG